MNLTLSSIISPYDVKLQCVCPMEEPWPALERALALDRALTCTYRSNSANGGPRSKKQKVPQRWPPCPEQLRYEDGEKIGDNSDARVQGSSSAFYRTWFKISGRAEDSFGVSGTRHNADVLRSLSHGGEVVKVLDELYRVGGFTSDDEDEGSRTETHEAFVRVFNNNLRPQYYLWTIGTEDMVTHVTHNLFWMRSEKNQDIVSGEHAYSRGFLWCNTSPNWMWNRSTISKRIIRCRIDLPIGTQVIIDRSPVFGGEECQFDQNERISRFPDVLLPPAKFEIAKVKHHPAPETRINDDSFVLLGTKMKKNHDYKLTDEEYASYVFYENYNADEFIDVRLVMTHMMKLEPRQ